MPKRVVFLISNVQLGPNFSIMDFSVFQMLEVHRGHLRDDRGLQGCSAEVYLHDRWKRYLVFARQQWGVASVRETQEAQNRRLRQEPFHAEFPGSAAADVGSNTTEVRGRRAGVCLSDSTSLRARASDCLGIWRDLARG